MTRTILTAGYAGRQPVDLVTRLLDLDAVLVDVRRSPRSRVPGWNLGNLARLLGERYIHLPQWGNLRYKLGPPIEIADFDAGLRIIEASTWVPVLLCVCKDAATCHRTVLADRLKGVGWACEELVWDHEEPHADPQLPLLMPDEEGRGDA